MLRLFSNRKRPPHLGPYPLEALLRTDSPPAWMSRGRSSEFEDAAERYSVSHSMVRSFQLYSSFRDGTVAATRAPIPDDLERRTANLKSLCYFLDASMAGACRVPVQAILDQPVRTGQPGIEVTPDDYAIAILVEYTREPRPGEPGYEWIIDTQAQRAALRAAEVAVVLAAYIRRLGWPARAHIWTATELDPEQILLAAGMGEIAHKNGVEKVANPLLGTRFGVAIVSTAMQLMPDRPLAKRGIAATWRAVGGRWWLGIGGTRPGWTRITGELRPHHSGPYPMEKIKRVKHPTTYLNPAQVQRVPKRHAFFTRAFYGDLGEAAKRESVRWRYSSKDPLGVALGLPIVEGIPLQYGQAAEAKAPGTEDPKTNADAVKALCHHLGADMVGITPAYDYLWYSHDHDGTPIEPYHKNAVVVVIDQSQETMAGSCGDDWISGAQSMRAYMRGALVTGVVAEHIRRLGWPARTHTSVEEDVLHIPLLLNAGLGELSRIGELVLNPYVGPRFKCAVITTDLPLEPDRPIDFGLQDFCQKCNKCARECPVQAIPYGDKILFNGYETWKPDVQKCANYRITNAGGTLCGRCMATCPWQSEGVLTNRIVLWAAIHLPFTRRWIAKLDDIRGNGLINPIKKWWFDLEEVDGKVGPARKVNARPLHFNRRMNADKQKIAVFPPELAPSPAAREPVPVDRQAGLAAQARCEQELKILRSDRYPGPAHDAAYHAHRGNAIADGNSHGHQILRGYPRGEQHEHRRH